VTVAIGPVLGKVALLTAAVLGVAAAAVALGPLFVVLKLTGGAYLVWLAVGVWRRARVDAPPAEQAATRSRLLGVGARWRGIGLGALLTVSNPQALIFYVAVLPAVLGGHRVSPVEYLLLCAVLVMVMALVAPPTSPSPPASAPRSTPPDGASRSASALSCSAPPGRWSSPGDAPSTSSRDALPTTDPLAVHVVVPARGRRPDGTARTALTTAARHIGWGSGLFP